MRADSNRLSRRCRSTSTGALLWLFMRATVPPISALDHKVLSLQSPTHRLYPADYEKISRDDASIFAIRATDPWHNPVSAWI
jgi:hypothetical protein